jgi:excisionase family DNA binding protein
MKTPAFYFADHPLGAREKQISTRELAAFLRVSTRTVHAWKAQGKIPYWKIGQRILRYELSAVEAALGKPPNE